MKRTRLAKYRSLWKLVIALALVSLVLPGGDASGVGQSRDASEAPVASTLTESGVQQADPGVYVSPPVEPHRVKVDPQSLQVAPSKEVKTVPEGEPLPAGPPPPRAPISDPVIQLTVEGALQDTPPNVEGVGLTSGSDVHMVYLPILMQQQGREPEIGMISDPVVSVPGIATFIPPDTVGDVGTNHYVQMVNATQFRIWDKSGNPLTGAMIFGNLWPAGDPCNSNLGDPIVVFDHLADRWLLSQFFATSFDALGNPLPPFFECIAISQTPDPTAGTWFLYTFEVPNFPDYPKFGVWPDGYYMSSYEFPDLGVYVFDRANMLLGNAARFFRDDIPALGTASVRDTRILPSDLDGPPPPIGTPNYFARPVDDQQDPGSDDRIEVYEARVDWLAPSFTFTLVDTLTPAPFQTMLCSRNGQGIRDCIPQPDEVDTVDALSNRPMMQLKYRAFGTYTAMVFNQTIDVSGSIPDLFDFTPANEVAGIRWYELRKTGANWSIFQQGTFAPQPNCADGETELLHRWMGSAAMDKYGNIALGYSIVNDDDDNGEEVYPGIRYTGRRFDDLPGLMPQGEKIILNGTNSQGNGDGTVDPQRWGDYSAMSVDPVDDCTFWFTAHVAGGLTQIASFRFDTCGTDLSIEKSATPDPATAGAQLSYGITVINNGSNTATDVIVTDVLPPEVTYLADTDSCIEFPVGTLTCSLGDLLPGQTETFTILVEVDADLVANAGGPTTITNSAEVTAEQPDPNLTNNTATVMTLVNELADLRVSKDCKPDRPVLAGDSATCTITAG